MKCKHCAGTGIFVIGRGEGKVYLQCPVCGGSGDPTKKQETIDVVQYLKDNIKDDPDKDLVIDYVERLILFNDLNKANGL